MKKGIPASNGAFRNWEVNFLNLIVANQGVWGLDNMFVTMLQSLQMTFATTWAIVSTGDCAPSQRVAMRDAKAAYIAALRPFIQSQIMFNQSISDAQIDQLGLKRRDTKLTPVPRPTTVPDVEIMPVYVHKAKVYFKQQIDAEGVSRRGKPKGVQFIEFAYNIGTAPNSAEDCEKTGLASRSPLLMEFTEANAGKKLYFYARWVNPRGEGGEYTSRQEFIIP